ncbi:MAG: phosphoglycolate phosphatase [Cellvibrionaceae bacterium]
MKINVKCLSCKCLTVNKCSKKIGVVLLLIFDWDGTLSDSADKIIDCLQQAAVNSGKRVCERDAIRNIIGLGLPEAMSALYPELNSEEREEIRQAYVTQFLAADQQPSPFFGGVMEGLHQLRENNYLLAVATGKSRRGLDRVLKNLDLSNFFHGSRCADETRSKPHPQMLSELLGQFSKTADNALMVGDTEYDMSMAEQLNIPRVAVSYGAHDVNRLKQYRPVLCVDHFSNFVAWVLKNG